MFFISITLISNSLLCFSISKGTAGTIPTLAPREGNQSSPKSDSSSSVWCGGNTGVGKVLSQPDWLVWNELEGVNGNRAGIIPVSHCSFHCSGAAPHGNEEPPEPTLPAQPVLLCSSVKMGVEKLLQDFCSTITSQEFPSCQQSRSKAWDGWHLQGWEGMAGKSPHLSPQ